jgi:hypothetical protein
MTVGSATDKPPLAATQSTATPAAPPPPQVTATPPPLVHPTGFVTPDHPLIKLYNDQAIALHKAYVDGTDTKQAEAELLKTRDNLLGASIYPPILDPVQMTREELLRAREVLQYQLSDHGAVAPLRQAQSNGGVWAVTQWQALTDTGIQKGWVRPEEKYPLVVGNERSLYRNLLGLSLKDDDLSASSKRWLKDALKATSDVLQTNWTKEGVDPAAAFMDIEFSVRNPGEQNGARAIAFVATVTSPAEVYDRENR